MNRRVLVVGAGIAGASIATLLGRAGEMVTLVERDRGQRSSGSPVDVRGSALPVVERLGVAGALRRSDTGVRHVEFVDAHGRRRARAALRRNSAADVEISRSALTRTLCEAAAEVAEIVFGDGPERLDVPGTGADVTFASGGQAHFDLVIGADGQHSTVRRLVFGPESTFSEPLGLAVATVPVDDTLVSANDVVQVCNVPGACLSVHPAGGHPIAAFIFRVEGPAPRTRDDQRRVLKERFEGLGWLSAELLRAADDADDLYFDSVNRVVVPHWSRGPVALLGDAAASITILGEGCSLAISGAGALAEALSASDLGTALSAYDRVHRPQVVARQRGAGFGASVLVPRTARGVALRNLFVRVTGRV